MKRIEVKLSLPVVAPLLDVMRELAEGLRLSLAAPGTSPDAEKDFQQAWTAELLSGQNEDVGKLLALFNDEFFSEGMIAFDEENAEPLVRACAALRLRLKSRHLESLGDEALESGQTELAQLDEPTRRAFMCYIFLATLQEIIIQHLSSSIIGS